MPGNIELLAPAGSPEALDAAIGEGADSVYLGLKNFNARMRSTNFTYAQFEAALRSLHRMGKKVYVTVNTVFEQREADRMYQLLQYLSSAGPDAIIVQDFGVLAMARSEFPKLKIHASTQMNIASSSGVNALSRHGVSRAVLARELRLEELRALRAGTNMELEVFAHGALCVCASGLCLFSSFLGGKSANRGMCTQACRRLYHSESAAVSKEGYYFSPADLQLLEYLPDLGAAGINAIKIEGRMKSASYVGAVVSAYRLVLDAIASRGTASDSSADDAIRQSIVKGQGILRGDFARGKTSYHFADSEKEHALNWLNPDQDGGTGISLGAIIKTQGRGDLKQGLVLAGDCFIRLAPGDTVRLHRSDDSARLSHKLSHAEPAKEGAAANAVAYWISIPSGFGKGDHVYLIQDKSLSKRYKPVISGEGRAGARSPGHDKAPLAARPEALLSARPSAKPAFPEGLYVAVSRIDDLYVVQSSRPVKTMLALTRKSARYMLSEGKKPLPFRPDDIILTLDPYFPQADVEFLQDAIPELIDLGYRQFMANNMGHFSLLRDKRSALKIIAGPWLYMFNSWALSFIASLGLDGYVSPLENNRQNLERTAGAQSRNSLRSQFFVPVFAWPPLFRIRANLGRKYDFAAFNDSRDEAFKLVCEQDQSLVYPEKPFSILDKIPFLKEAGFNRFIIDLSGSPLKKSDYKDLMRSAQEGVPLPNISRFNWKNGFFSNEEAGMRNEELKNKKIPHS